MFSRIDPDRCPVQGLESLNYFKNYLETKIQSETFVEKQQFEDALRVVNCLRFIKVNSSFIRYAFDNRETDLAIYRYRDDKAKGVLRDFHDTSFHLNGYLDVEKCLKDLSQSVEQFEKAYELVNARGKLHEFIGKLRYDQYIGCLAERMQPALDYAQQLESTTVEHFDDLMKKAVAGLTTDDSSSDAFRKVFTALKTNIGEVCLQGKSTEIRLTRGMIVIYMKNNLGYDLPENTIPHRSGINALQLIQDEKALIKVLSSPLVGGQSWNFITEQLFDPANVRPVKPIADRNREIVLNTKLWRWESRVNKGAQGRAKPDSKFTKKEATSLLPSNGKMHYFPVFGGEPIGLLFNIDECNLKEGKYIFKDNAGTNLRWWVGNDPTLEKCLQKTISLDTLRKYLRECIQNNTIPYHNEILAGLCKEALYAVFAAKDTEIDRLNALRIKYDLKASLGVDLPVLIIDPDGNEPREYNAEQLAKDIEFVNSYYFHRYRNVGQILDVILTSQKITQELLQQRYAISCMGEYAIHQAVRAGDIDYVIELCKKNANITLPDNNYQSALELALTHKDVSIKNQLIKALINHAKLDPTSESMGHILEVLVDSNMETWSLAFLHKHQHEFKHNLLLQKTKIRIYQEVKDKIGNSRLAGKLQLLGADKPVDEIGILNYKFKSALATIVSAMGENGSVATAKENFKTAVRELKLKTLQEFSCKRLTLDNTKQQINTLVMLAERVGANAVTPGDIENFQNAFSQYRTCSKWNIAISTVVGAVLGICLSAIVVASTLSLPILVVAAMAPILGGFAGNRFGIWQVRNDPVVKVERVAKVFDARLRA